MSFKTPILILCYNRPYKLKKLLNIVKKIKPLKIYFNCDGPKKNNLDIKNTNQVRNIIKKFNSQNNIVYNFNSHNLGCKDSVQKGLNFFFKHEKMGIILEDDCIPSLFFFKFCEYLLKKYKNNKKIYAISGFNITDKKKFGDGDYFLSKYFLCWGWATWRRSWKTSDKNLKFFPKWKKNKFLYKFHKSFEEAKYWDQILQKTYKKKINTWDYYFLASMWKSKAYCILPNFNFIKNIGFDQDGTHTMRNSILSLPKVDNVNKKIKNPTKLQSYKDSDRILINKLFKMKYFFYPARFLYIMRLLLSKFL